MRVPFNITTEQADSLAKALGSNEISFYGPSYMHDASDNNTQFALFSEDKEEIFKSLAEALEDLIYNKARNDFSDPYKVYAEGNIHLGDLHVYFNLFEVEYPVETYETDNIASRTRTLTADSKFDKLIQDIVNSLPSSVKRVNLEKTVITL
jgi:hypothetical protein